MAYFKTTYNAGVEKAIQALQMSLGVIVERFTDCMNIVTFERGDKELTLDVIGEFGCKFVVDLPIE